MAKQTMHAGKSIMVAAGQVIGLGIRFLTNILLAWFLVPADFGIAAIVTAILLGMNLFSDIGIRDSIIRHKQADLASFQSSAQMLQIVRGAVLFAVLILLSPILARFYDIDILQSCLILAGSSMLIRGFFSTRFYRLEREMKVMPMIMVDLAAAIATAIIVIALAYYYRNVWALMFSYPVGELVRTVISHYYKPGMLNPFKAELKFVKEIFSFGKWIFLSTLFTFLIIHSDKLIIGKLVDISSVGIYHLAASLAALLFGVTTKLVSRVVYPVVASASREGQKNLSEQLNNVLQGFIPLIISGTLFVFAVSPLFFHYLYPDAYNEAGSLAQVMALVFWFMIIYAILNVVPIAVNHPRASAKNSAITAAVRICLGLLGFYLYDLYGFIVGLGVGSVIGFLLLLRWLKRNVDLNQTYLLKLSVPVTVYVAVVLFSTRYFSDELMYQWGVLMLTVLFILAYLIYSYRHLVPKLMQRIRPGLS